MESKTRAPLLLVFIAVATLTVALVLPRQSENLRDPALERTVNPAVVSDLPESPSVRRESVGTDVPPDSTSDSGPPGRKYIPAVGQATLVGRVVDEAGRPRVDATVLTATLHHRDSMERHALADAQTGVAGSFRLSGLEPGVEYLVRATQNGCQPEFSDPTEPGSGATLDLGDLVLKTTCGVAGMVVDPDGNPIAGATVGRLLMLMESTRTDTDGRFSLSDLPPGQIRIGAEAPGFVDGRGHAPHPETSLAHLELEPGEQRDGLVIVLKPEGIIWGHVVDLDHRPLVEERFLITARVNDGEVTGAIRGRRAETLSEGGAFVLTQLDPDLSFDLYVLGLSGRRLTRQNVRCGVRDLIFEFSVLPAIQVAVRSEADGSPLLPDRILVQREGTDVCEYYPATWRDRQKDTPPALLWLPYRQAGAHELIVSKRGYRSFHSGPMQLDGQSSHGPIAATLGPQPPDPPDGTVIVLRADTREPLPDVGVSVWDEFLGSGRGLGKLRGALVSGLSAPKSRPFARTDEEGRFRVSGAFAYSLVLNDSCYSSKRLDLLPGSSLLSTTTSGSRPHPRSTI